MERVSLWVRTLTPLLRGLGLRHLSSTKTKTKFLLFRHLVAGLNLKFGFIRFRSKIVVRV